MAWIAPNTGETAAALETRLGTLGAKIEISDKIGYSIAYSGHGVRLLQKEAISATVFRGLSQTAAALLATQTADNTTSTSYYRDISGVTERAVAEITTGTNTEYTAGRANEADGWSVTKTVTTYSADTTGWTTSEDGTALSDVGVTVPISQDRTSTWQAGNEAPVSSVVTSTVVEIRNLTEAGKNAYLAQASNGARIRKHNYTSYLGNSGAVSGYMITLWSWFNHGTDVMVSARFISDDEGWTVTKTTKDYSFSPSGGGANTVGWWLE